eukprot:SAG31_NODE_3345_length_4377_cov_3.568256_3_plen_61_part_00
MLRGTLLSTALTLWKDWIWHRARHYAENNQRKYAAGMQCLRLLKADKEAPQIFNRRIVWQ